jgi:hypothetical protein
VLELIRAAGLPWEASALEYAWHYDVAAVGRRHTTIGNLLQQYVDVAPTGRRPCHKSTAWMLPMLGDVATSSGGDVATIGGW